MHQNRNVFAGPAPGCPVGATVLPVHWEDFEFFPSERWALRSTAVDGTWLFAGTGGIDRYATSGAVSAWAPGWNSSVVQALRTVNPIQLPPWPSVLTFDHAFGMEPGFDYGAVELSTDGGVTWFDAGPLFTHGGYNMDIANIGRRGFSGYSGGYASSQLDLRSLAGEDLMLQFAYFADASVGSAGWWIDEVRIHGCVTGVRPDAHLRAPASTTWVGNNTYNGTGVRQSSSAQVGPRGAATFTFRVENDGSTPEPMVVRGPGSNAQFKVAYLAGSTDVTEQVVAGTYETPVLGPGERSNLKVVVTARPGIPIGATTTVVVKVRSSALIDVKDAVRATVTRTR